MKPGSIFLDVTRLLLRAGRAAPTGIDRVELAYALHLHAMAPERLRYVAIHPLGRLARLPRRAVGRLVEDLAAAWSGQQTVPGPGRLLRAQCLWHLGLLTPLRRRHCQPGSIYLNVSHQYLDRPGPIRTVAAHGARIVCLVHDLIPVEWPEFVRPAAPARHRRRMRSLAELADGIIYPSAATQTAAKPWLAKAARSPAQTVIPLGIPSVPAAMPLESRIAGPYFVCLGTIEPRKNHLLLLHLWRRLAAAGNRWPRLYILGSRGWENENIVDLLERAPYPQGMVVEHASPDDRQVRELLAGARALLFPTIAEGYGLPVTEALALGVPVLCSDLPILREVGGGIPEYLDPFDLPGWLRAILDYSDLTSSRRRAQLARLQGWSPPDWNGHMRHALAFLDEIARR